MIMKIEIKYRDGHSEAVEADSFVEAVEAHKANLRRANLTGADLRGANTKGAVGLKPQK